MGLLSLAGKTAVVTGGSGGIGFAIASRFAREGANIILAGRTRSKLQVALTKLEKMTPLASLQTHRMHQLDVTDSEAWKSLVDRNVTSPFS